MSINIIIIAAIALLVLVIISVLLFRSGSGVQTGTSCTGIGGKCSNDVTCGEIMDYYEGSYIPTPNYECPEETPVCCLKI